MPRILTEKDRQRRAIADKEFNEMVASNPEAVRLVAAFLERNTMATYTYLCHSIKEWAR